MSNWKGLDPGGTEQLWDSDLLKDVLGIFHENEPFSRGDKLSPIYPELEAQYPDITWRNNDSTGFRAIFRKTNPWVKLGLTTDGTTDALVTPIGAELLSGEKSIQDIFVSATKNHQESDGVYSFAVMCRAALEAPSETFTLEDVEYGVSEGYANGKHDLTTALANVRTKGLTFPHQSRRVRTLRSFMNALVDSGALVNTSKGWMLNDPAIASDIAQIQLASIPSGVAVASGTVSPLAIDKRVPTSAFQSIDAGKRTVSPFSTTSAGIYDPAKKALLLEKANSLHELMVELCADGVRSVGGNPIEDQNSFDVAERSMCVMFEVKSVNQINAISQVRKAVAQLLEYRYRHRNFFARKPQLFLVTNQPLGELIDAELIDFLTLDQSINLIWMSGGKLVTSSGISLPDFLTQP